MTYQLTEEESGFITDKFNRILKGSTIKQAPFSGYAIIAAMQVVDFGGINKVNLLIKKGKEECVVDLFDYLISTEDYFGLQ